MSDLRDDLLNAAKERWHTKTGLLAAIGAVTVMLVGAFAGISLDQVSRNEWMVVAAGAVTVWLVWARTRLPRVPKGMVGFGIAIECDDDPSSKQAVADFVLALREHITGSRFRHRFQFVELPPSLVKQLTDQDRAASVARRSNLHFLLHGRARLRTVGGGPAHVFDLRGLVRHAAIEKLVSEQFGQEFGSSLPNRIFIGFEQSFLACEFAAKHIDVVAKYIIGTAAALSNDFPYAEQLLTDSKVRLEGLLKEAQGAPLSVVLDRVQTRLRELYHEWLNRLIRRYTVRREVEALRLAEGIVLKLRQYDESSYAAHLAAGMCAFVLRHDVPKAKEEIEACRGQKDATWRYSQAFLLAYEGDLDAAYRAYAKAFAASLEDGTVPTQAEEFIQIVLDDDPERVWLYYCLGLINYRAKGDLVAAKRDLETFVGSVDEARFPKPVESSRKWLAEIETLFHSRPPG